jgi:hypothetical protein
MSAGMKNGFLIGQKNSSEFFRPGGRAKCKQIEPVCSCYISFIPAGKPVVIISFVYCRKEKYNVFEGFYCTVQFLLGFLKFLKHLSLNNP